VLEGETCLTHCGTTVHPDSVILSALQMCVRFDAVILKAVLKAFPMLNNSHVVRVISFLYVSARYSEFTVGFEGKQCTRTLPADPRKLWLWCLSICRIAFCHFYVWLLGHFKVTGAGFVPFDNLQELDKWFIYWAYFSASVNPLKTNITVLIFCWLCISV